MIPLLLGSLFELKYGKSLRKDTRAEGAIPVFGSNGQVDVHSEALVNHPTIIVGRKGSIGEVHLVKTPCWPIDTTYYVSPRGEHEFDLDWLYRLLRTLRLQELNRSAAIPGLNREDVYRISIHLPALNDQIRIAHLLSKVEGLIAQRKQHLQQLDDLLKSVFLEMFGDPVRNEKGWDISSVEGLCADVIDCPHSTPIYSELVTSNYCVRSSDIVDGYLELRGAFQVEDAVYFERIKRYKPQPDDIVYSREGGRLGNAARITGQENICLGQRMMLFKVDADNRCEFLWALLESAAFKSKLQSLVGGGAAPRVNIKDLKKVIIIKPPVERQDDFASHVRRVDRIRDLYRRGLADLEDLYGALSKKAFKGELDLSHVVLQPAPGNLELKGHAPSVMVGAVREERNTIDLPDVENMVEKLATLEGRQSIYHHWLEAYFAQLNGSAFSVNTFLEDAQTRISELCPESDLEIGISEYEYLKEWLFKALNNGRLSQVYDDAGNRVQLATVKG